MFFQPLAVVMKPSLVRSWTSGRPGSPALTMGGVAGALLSSHSSKQVPKVVQLRMVFNVLIDLLLGVVPFFGDAIDFFWKSNTKNFALLERHVQLESQAGRAGSAATAGDWVFVLAVIAVIVGVALIPIFVMYWLLHAVGPRLPAFTG